LEDFKTPFLLLKNFWIGGDIMKKKVKIIQIKNNSFGYRWNCQIWVNNYYTGRGKFFKTKFEAENYKKRIENK